MIEFVGSRRIFDGIVFETGTDVTRQVNLYGLTALTELTNKYLVIKSSVEGIAGDQYLNINSLGAKKIQVIRGDNKVNPMQSWVYINQLYLALYDGTEFIVSPLSHKSAEYLETARKISATGDVLWNVTFDGSGDVTSVASLKEQELLVAGKYQGITVSSRGIVTQAETINFGTASMINTGTTEGTIPVLSSRRKVRYKLDTCNSINEYIYSNKSISYAISIKRKRGRYSNKNR